MKINELRKIIKPYNKDKLNYIIAELYKAIPKAVKEDKSVDHIVMNPSKTKNSTKAAKKTILIDLVKLEDEVNEFCANAKEQLYIAPNRIVPKKKRSGWRFIAKRFYNDLNLAAGNKNDLELVTELLENLYAILSAGTSYHIFATTDTFRAINVSQTEFLQNILKLNLQWLTDSVFATKLVELISNNETDHDLLASSLHEAVFETVKSSELREMIFAACIKKIAKIIATPVTKGWSNDEYQQNHRINNLAEFMLCIAAENSDPEQGVAAFNKYYNRNDKFDEVKLYVLLRLLFKYKLSDLIVSEYENALKKKIVPRQGLTVLYQAAQRGELPEYMPSNY